jgi:hypothetical protein
MIEYRSGDDRVAGCAQRKQGGEHACRNAARVAKKQDRDQYQQDDCSAAQRGLDEGHVNLHGDGARN